MARPPEFDLAKALASPSFTPGRGDAAGLIAIVAGGEEPATGRAGPALVKLGEHGRRAVIDRLEGGGVAAAGAVDSHAMPTVRAATDRLEGGGGDAAVRVTTEGDGASGVPAGSGGPGVGAGRAAAGGFGASIEELDDGARARLVTVVGLFARAGDGEALHGLLARMGDAAVRVRRAAAVALGKVGGEEARAALVARWDAAASDGGPPADERRALAEALGKVGGDEARARLAALETGGDAELARRRDRAILMADRSARRDEASTIATDAWLPERMTVRLSCRPGLAPLLGAELDGLGLSPHLRGESAASVRLLQPWRTLFASRLWATAAIEVPLAGARDARPDALAAAVTRTILGHSVRELFRAWTRGPIRWRLAFAEGTKRSLIWRIARDVTAADPALVNDPTATTWDLLVDEEQWRLEVVPRRAEDPRFAYRVAEVPAASHPTVAAALAFAAAPRDGARIWDPFCGSGLELVECARRGIACTLFGSDLDDEALDAARANLEAAGVTAQLSRGDARTFVPGAVDLVVTNPPLGSRVAVDAAALLCDSLPNFARRLARGGRLVWITPSARRTGPAAERAGLARLDSWSVDLGGVRGTLEVWERRA